MAFPCNIICEGGCPCGKGCTLNILSQDGPDICVDPPAEGGAALAASNEETACFWR